MNIKNRRYKNLFSLNRIEINFPVCEAGVAGGENEDLNLSW